MGKRDDLIATYAEALRTKCGMEPDIPLLTKVTIGCGPAIYDADGGVVDTEDPQELQRLRTNFLMRKLGLRDDPALMDAINAVIETYGRSEPVKYRAVIHYMLTRHFARDAAFR